MSFLLDTNILSHYLRRPSGLTHRFVQHRGRLYTSTLNFAELYVWAFRRPRPEEALNAISRLLTDEVGVLDHDLDCARIFGEVRAGLLNMGRTHSVIDLMIASVALAHDLTLITNNRSDFDGVPNLRLQDWLAPA